MVGDWLCFCFAELLESFPVLGSLSGEPDLQTSLVLFVAFWVLGLGCLAVGFVTQLCWSDLRL